MQHPNEKSNPTEISKGRLVFQVPSSDEDSAVFYPPDDVCTTPRAGMCGCGSCRCMRAES